MRYLVNQKYFTMKDSYTITDANGHPVYVVSSKLISVGKEFTISTPDGRKVLFIKKKIRIGRSKFDVFNAQNQQLLTIQSRFKAFGAKLSISSNVVGFDDCTAEGSITNWNFHIFDDKTNQEITTISKKVLKIADTYAVDILPDYKKYDYILLGVVIVLDYLYQPKH